MEEVVGKEVADNIVSEWLDSLDIAADKRSNEFISLVINDLVRAVQRGLLVFNNDGTVTQKLIEPLGEKGVTTEVVYNNRYRIGEWHKKLKSVQKDDNMGMVFAKLSLLSGSPVLLFEKMIRQDYDVASSIVVFF